MENSYKNHESMSNLSVSPIKPASHHIFSFSKIQTNPAKRASSPMTKSMIKLEPASDEIMSLKHKIFQITRTLTEHSKEILLLKENKDSFSNYSSTDTLRNSIQSDSTKSVHNIDLLSQQLHSNILQQITKIKAQLSIVATKQQIELQLTNLKNNFQESIISQMNKEIGQIRSRIVKEGSSLRQEFSQRINNMHEANRKVFAHIQADMKEFSVDLQALSPGKIQIFSSKRKFQSPILIKYKQMVQNMNGKKQAVINEVTYYLDNRGCLLDNNFCYLVDKNGKEIKLSEKQLQILNLQEILE